MRILIVTDAWKPQINGVVRTLEAVIKQLKKMGHEILVVGPDPDQLTTFGLPTYPEIKLEFFGGVRVARMLHNFAPDYIHIATEGPLGWAARRVCVAQGRPFTTAYHTHFPKYVAQRVPGFLSDVAFRLAAMILRRFHQASSAVLVATSSVEKELEEQGYDTLVRWSRGVELEVFKPYGKILDTYKDLPRPILLTVGRVAVEKNLHAFLKLKTTGSKVVIGDGPDREYLQHEYPEAHFLGSMKGEQLARHYAAADVFVFPSKTDTFGLVLLEACACGLRIAAYPSPGPVDLFKGGRSSEFVAMDTVLQNAVDRALELTDAPDVPRAFVGGYSWLACAEEFLDRMKRPVDDLKREQEELAAERERLEAEKEQEEREKEKNRPW